MSQVLERDQPVNAARSTRSGKPRGRPQAVTGAARAEEILKSFNTWAYKREQPSCADRLRAVALAAVEADRPVPFVLYWGKGPRAAVGAPERACLDYLASMAERVAAVHRPGAAIRLILTDTHAKLNGHAVEAVESYFSGVTAAAAARGFETVRLSRLVEDAAVALPPEEERPSGDVLESLIACAAKWYRGEGSTEGGAVEYYRMNMVEKRAVEHAYPEAVFVTFNGAEFRELFPSGMPIFYMYSLRRGFGVKPWFMPDEGGERAAPVQLHPAPAP